MENELKTMAEAFLLDRQGCPDNPWINKRVCAHCLETLLKDVVAEAQRRGEERRHRLLNGVAGKAVE